MARVFVYGTLKRGYRNNYILERAEFVGSGQTVAKCRLFNAGFPVLRRRAKKDGEWNAPVRGEVFNVTDEETMQRLDRLESEGRMYHRRKKKIRLDDGTVILANTYVGDTGYWQNRAPLYPAPQSAYEWARR